MRKLTLEQFLEKAKLKHGNRYDYSKVFFKTIAQKIEIICLIHGSFWQLAAQHIHAGHGCPYCSNGILKTKEWFIEQAKLKHGNKFDYSKVEYTGIKKQIIIICPIHGEFLQMAEKHLSYGCSACAGNKRNTKEEFIEKAKKIHNERYIYDNVDYISLNSKVNIICREHGVFGQTPKNHLHGRGCKYCAVGNTSNIEQLWLDYLSIPDDSKHRNVHLTINGRRFIVDGYYPKTNLVYEFLGDYFHGNPAIYDLTEYNSLLKKSYQELFDKTKEKISFLRKNGFKVISIWENKFRKIIKKK